MKEKVFRIFFSFFFFYFYFYFFVFVSWSFSCPVSLYSEPTNQFYEDGKQGLFGDYLPCLKQNYKENG